jgi:hypothetical protein
MGRPLSHIAILTTVTLLACAPSSEEGAHGEACPDADLVEETDITVDDTTTDDTTTDDTTTDDTTTEDTGDGLDPDFVALGPGEGRYWEVEARGLPQDECSFGHFESFDMSGDGLTLLNHDRTYQTFTMSPDGLTLGHTAWGHSLSASVGSCRYEVDGSFSCEAWHTEFDKGADLQTLPGWPYGLTMDTLLDFTITASGQFGPRSGEANGAPEWDFGMRWATDVTLELTMDCTGVDCVPPPEISVLPCTTILELSVASLDDPNIP